MIRRVLSRLGLVSLAGASIVACTVPSPPPPSTTSTTAPPFQRAVPFDFDHDGRADLVYVRTSLEDVLYLRVGSPDVVWQGHGPPAHGDWDGDGIWDFGDFDPAGVWHTSGDREPFAYPRPNSGQAGDGSRRSWAVPAVYDTDHKMKAAWYDDSNATWYIEGRDPIQFGIPDDNDGIFDQDVAVPGDYDGDGVDDLAVYRPSTSSFHVMGTSDSVQVGTTGDVPVPADYDGDGDLDPATYDPATGIWHIAGQPDQQVGLYSVSDFVAPANYDGIDGVDLATYRQTDTTDSWHISGQAPITLGPTPRPLSGPLSIAAPLVYNDVLLTLRMARLRRCYQDPVTNGCL